MTTKTLSKKVNVPSGYIFVHEKWQGSSFIQDLCKKTRGCCYDDLGFVDFFPSVNCPVIYIHEADMVCTSTLKAKLKLLATEYPSKGVVIAVRNSSTLEAFNEIQKFAVIYHHLTVVPILSQSDLAELLAQMVKMENTSPHNPFKFKKAKQATCSDKDQQIALLSIIPGVREAKALKLLRVFGTMTAISNAPFEKLADVVGNAVAKSVFDFLH